MGSAKKISFRAFAEVLAIIAGTIATVYLARTIGPEFLGLMVTCVSVVQLSTKLADAGLTAYATQKLARDDHGVDQLVRAIMPVKVKLAVVIMLLGIMIARLLPIDHKLSYFISVSIVAILFEIISPFWVFTAMGKIYQQATVRLTHSVLYLMIVLLMVRRHTDWVYIPYLIIVNAMLPCVVSFVILKWIDKNKFRLFCLIAGGESKPITVLRDSRHFLKAELSMWAYTLSDRIILYSFTTPHAVGIYEAAYKVINPFYTIASVVSPSMFRELAQGFKLGEVGRVMKRYVLLMGAATIPLGFFLLIGAEPIILTVFGQQFEESINILKILGFVITFGFTSGIIVIPFSAWNMSQEYGGSIFFGNVVNVVFNFILIPPLAGVGAAVATLAAKIVVTVVGYHHFRRAVRYPILADFGWFFFWAVIPLGCAWGLVSVGIHPWLALASYGLIYVAGIALWQFKGRDQQCFL